MTIEERLKDMQPEIFKKLNKIKRNKGKQHTKKKREERVDVKELMQQRYYRRGRGGAMKQVR